MGHVPLLGGAYQSRSVIANAQRCINLFPEVNPKDSPVQVTHYQRPGLRLLAQGPNAPVRGLYQAGNNNGYAVIGQQLFLVGPAPAWTLTPLGVLTPPAPMTTPVSMTDNGQTLVVVDSSPFGYSVNLADTTGASFAQIADKSGFFQGAAKVDFMDTFLLWNFIGTQQFGSSLSNSVAFDPSQFGSKTGKNDILQTLAVLRHEIYLLGLLSTEIWYDAGNAQFPFAELPGAFIEHGTLAPFSAATADVNLYFLGNDRQSATPMVLRIAGYAASRISNHALEVQLRLANKLGTLKDAIGYTYQQDGHIFYVLQLPSANQTWVWDESSKEWHQRCWTNPADGTLNRDRSNCFAVINQTPVVGDFANGALYALDPESFTDSVAGQAGPITYLRSFPHLQIGMMQGQEARADGKRMQFSRFQLDIECGTGPLDNQQNPAQVALRWSSDRGKTFKEAVLQSTGAPGVYETFPLWRQIGISRDMVFEVSWSFSGAAALQGAWIDAEVLPT